MDESTLKQILDYLESGEQEKLEHIYQFLGSLQMDNHAGNTILNSIYSPNISDFRIIVCLSIIKRYGVPLDNPFALLPLCINPNQTIVSMSSQIISNYVKSEEQISALLSLDPSYYEACIFIIMNCIDNNVFSPNFIEFLINVYNGTESIDMKVKVANSISEILIKTRICDQRISNFYTSILQCEVSNENLPILYALIPGTSFAMFKGDAFQLLLNYFAFIAQMCPLPYINYSGITFSSFSQQIALELYNILFMEDDDSSNFIFDAELIVKSCVCHCLLDDESIELFTSDMSAYIDYLTDEESLRSICVKILSSGSLSQVTINVCKEMWSQSEAHEEACLYILSGILAHGHPFVIQPPIPTENIFAITQYFRYVIEFEEETSPSIISEALDEEYSYIVYIPACEALANRPNGFDEETVLATEKIVELIHILGDNLNTEHLTNILCSLVKRSPMSFGGILEEFCVSLLEIISVFFLNPSIYGGVVSCFQTLSKINDFHAALVNGVAPHVIEMLQDQNACACGVDMCVALLTNPNAFENMEDKQESSEQLCEALFSTIDFSSLDHFVGEKIAKILFYFAKIGAHDVVLQATVVVLQNMEGQFFKRFASVLLELIDKSDDATIGQIFELIHSRLTSKDSNVLAQVVCCVFSVLAINSKEALDAKIGNLKDEIINLFVHKALSENFISTFDLRLMACGLLLYHDVNPLAVRAVVSLLKQSSEETKSTFAFCKNDSIYFESELRTQSLQEIVSKILPDVSALDPDLQAIIQSILSE